MFGSVNFSLIFGMLKIKENQDKLLVLTSNDNFNVICKLLSYIIPKLFRSNGLTSFHNKTFELILTILIKILG